MRTFTYDIDNNLASGSAPTTTTLYYDPLGRLWSQTSGGTETRQLFDGDELSTDYADDGSAILYRVVPSGLGPDSPLVWFSGSAVTTPFWLHADVLGSIVAQSGPGGYLNPATKYGYDPYGVPDTTNGFGGPPLKYTGQMSLPTINLYYYKARDYDPNLGRFLQVDPAGYSSDINAYAYVGNDPLNSTDPSGLDPTCKPNCGPATPVAPFPVLGNGCTGSDMWDPTCTTASSVPSSGTPPAPTLLAEVIVDARKIVKFASLGPLGIQEYDQCLANTVGGNGSFLGTMGATALFGVAGAPIMRKPRMGVGGGGPSGTSTSPLSEAARALPFADETAPSWLREWGAAWSPGVSRSLFFGVPTSAGLPAARLDLLMS